jgi:hypothetical protein
MTAFEAYVKFLALKQHFTSDYDYQKYCGKVRADPSKFEVKKDKYLFQKLAKRLDPEMYIVANLIDRDVTWIGDLFGEAAEKAYTDWLKRKESLTYVFKQDIGKLLDEFDKNFVVEDGQHPYLLKLYKRKMICIETLIILDDILDFTKHWNKRINDSVMWPTIYRKCLKYRPFLEYTKGKYRTILKDKFV